MRILSKIKLLAVVAIYFTIHNFWGSQGNLAAQTDTLYYLYSDFEDADDQSTWHFEPSGSSYNWDFLNGGALGSPPVAASGVKNAHFNFVVPGTTVNSNLISSPIDLSDAKKPQLAFQYSQPLDVFENRVAVLFQAGDGAPWDTIRKYSTDVNFWEEATFNIDEEGEKYLCEGFRVAFLAFNKWNNGVSVDSVVIQEQDIISKFVKSFEFSTVENEIITSKAEQVPLVKLKINISGNDGPISLRNLSFQLTDGQADYFKTNGFKIFHTIDNAYTSYFADTSTQIGPAVSMVGSEISFTGIDQPLKLGDNYIWLTADFEENIDNNSYFSIGVNANSFQVNDTILPVSGIANITGAYIKEAFFFDNFSTDKGWTLEDDFEIAIPVGFSGVNSRDPDYPFSGTRVLGTDLTVDGYYKTNVVPATGYYAYSPVFNLEYYNNCQVYMRIWNDIHPGDSATMAVSNDGGTTWHIVWMSYDDPTSISYWKELLLDVEVEELMSRKENVQFRFGMNKTGSNLRFGMNIDQFTIVGNHLDTDVGITEIISPFDDCLGFNNDTVKIVLRNYAEGNSPNVIPVFYAPWGLDSTIIEDSFEGIIPQGDSVIFTFNSVVNFPRGDIYGNFTCGINLDGDEDPTNDNLVKSLYIQDSHTPSILTDFEYKGGVWIPDDNEIWQCKIPGSITPLPGSENSWLLYPDGNYANSDFRTISSACYDLTSENQFILQLKYNLETGDNNDGFAIEYSTDDGETWSLVDTSIYGRNWGWYTNVISSLGHIGWTGSTSGWVTAKEILPAALATENKVKFRVKWATDASGVAIGLAFDDFELFPAPNDVGVSAITNPDSACQFINTDTVHVYVKNFGYNDLKTNDTIIVGVDFESDSPIIDTVMLASPLAAGDSILIKIPTAIDIDNPGTYSLSAYTLIEDDPYYYGTNNDTLSRTFTIWPNPVSGMVDSLYSREPDTLVITPNFEAGWTYLWFDGLTTQSHAVSESDIFYSVTITESAHSCQTEDSTYVQLLFNDIGIGSIVWPRNSCELLPNELVEVSVKNKGTDSIPGDSKFVLYYEVNGDSIIKDTITISDALQAGDSIPHIFSKTYDFSGLGDYTIKASAYFGGDTVRTNDTVVNTISVFGYTPISLGPDYSVKQLADTLDAGPVFASYLWSTGDETQTTIIDTSGKYWVDVVDVNGCAGVDTVDVFLKIRDIEADLLVNPFTSCDRAGPESMQFQIRNNGSDTILTSDVINVDYRLDGGTVNEEAVVLSSDLLPGEQFIHSFATTEDVSAYTSYTFDLTARTVGDLRTSNDSLSVTIETHQTPTVDLGGDRTVNGYQLVLDAGAGTNYSYLWNDNSTYQTLTATTNGNYWVTVTDSVTGCFAGDTVLITFDITDYAIQSFAIEDNPCSESYNNVEVKVLNNGNNIRNNATIKVGFFVEGDDPIVEDYTVDGVWLPLNEISINLTSPIDLTSSLGATDITVYLDQAGDLNPGNDVLTRTVNVREAPTVPIDGDTINTTLPYTIDATSPGDDNFYQWGDNTTGPLYTANVYGEYTVYVRTSNGCETVAHVWIDVPSYINEAAMENLDISLYPNPAQDILNINAELKTGDEFIIEMFDISNRIVFSEIHHGYGKYENKIDVNNMSQGVYFVRVRNKEIYFVKRIIVK